MVRKVKEIPKPKLFNVIEETSATLFTATGLLPEDASGVDEVAKQDRRRDVTEQAEYHELHAQGERSFLLTHRSEI